MWPARIHAARAAGWPRLAEARGSLRRDLALQEASAEPAGEALSHLVFHIGAYPVALLWGCAPPLMALRARWRRRGGGGGGDGGGGGYGSDGGAAAAAVWRARLGDAALLALAAASAAFVAANAAADTRRCLGVGAGLARWER